MATLSIRLSAETVSLFEFIVRQTGMSKPDVIRAAIKAYAQKLEANSGPSFYDKIKDYVGVWESSDPHLSMTTGDEIARMMLEERQLRDLGRRRTTRRVG